MDVNMLDILVLLSVCFSLFDVGSAGGYCLTNNFLEYCSFGCCGSGIYQKCCSSLGPVIGIVIGAFVLVISVLVIIGCCRKKANTGSVLTQQTAGYTTTTTGMTPQQQTTIVCQQQGAGYVYPKTTVGYTPVPTVPQPNQMGYPYQQGPIPPGGYQQTVPTGYQQPPPVGYQQPPQSGYPQHPPSGYPQPPPTGYQQSPPSGYQQLPSAGIQHPPPPQPPGYQVQQYQHQPQAAPSAPPPCYDDIQKVPQ